MTTELNTSNTEKKQEEESTSSTDSKAEQNESSIQSLEEALQKIEHLQSVNREVIESRDKIKSKLRTFEEEKTAEEQAVLQEQGKFKELAEIASKRAEEYESAYKDVVINSAIEKKLAETGIPSEALQTAKALLDKNSIQLKDNSVDEQSVADAIETLKTNHSVLFNVRAKTPDVKRAEESSSNTYLEELKKIRSNPRARDAKKQLAALRARYGKE